MLPPVQLLPISGAAAIDCQAGRQECLSLKMVLACDQGEPGAATALLEGLHQQLGSRK